MCGSDNEPGPHDPDVVASLKELAGKGSGKHRIVCESDGVATEYWLEGGEVPSAGQAAPSMAAFEAAALSEVAALVPKLESELDGKEVADLDGIEIAIRDVTHSSGAAMYKSLLERVDAELPTPDCPQCGKPMERHQKFGKSFASRLGPVEVERTYCRCRGCGSGFFPQDRALGLEGQTTTPGAASIVADAVVSDSFEEASRKLRNLAGVKVPATTLRRWNRELGEEAQRFEREIVEERKPGAERVYVDVVGGLKARDSGGKSASSGPNRTFSSRRSRRVRAFRRRFGGSGRRLTGAPSRPGGVDDVVPVGVFGRSAASAGHRSSPAGSTASFAGTASTRPGRWFSSPTAAPGSPTWPTSFSPA
ncbi:MAG: UPF0236 family protein [Albidovulum sp.]|nr:UPF0236 family protein [Albidovulum sp.]